MKDKEQLLKEIMNEVENCIQKESVWYMISSHMKYTSTQLYTVTRNKIWKEEFKEALENILNTDSV